MDTTVEPRDIAKAGPMMAPKVNGHSLPRPPHGWRKNPDAAMRYATALGLKIHPGDSMEAAVGKIEARIDELTTIGRH